eukprot:TRINITY_DN392_c0_g1_i1.p1 TRINITY_DN392_c0_g1~~TRINITY_DN392_c0_g1_i1.p1  ORF type:complete len:1416 (+),score=421.82 TRINITY_DN392_c0_g1_i1:687-4934(+)
MTSLSSQQAPSEEEVGALCHLLGIAMSDLNDSVLRAKFTMVAEVLLKLLQEHSENVPIARSLVRCISLSVHAQDSSVSWSKMPAMMSMFQALLSRCVDSNAKIRHISSSSIVTLVRGDSSSSSSSSSSSPKSNQHRRHVSPTVVKFVEHILASEKAKKVADKVTHTATLHLLNLLKGVLPHLTPTAMDSICTMLVRLLDSGDAMLSLHSMQCLACLLASLPDVSTEFTSSLLATLIASPAPTFDEALPVAHISLVVKCMIHLHEKERSVCEERLVTVVKMLLKRMVASISAKNQAKTNAKAKAAEKGGGTAAPVGSGARLRKHAAMSLRELLSGCVDSALIARAVKSSASTTKPKKQSPSVLELVIGVLENALSYTYKEVWADVLAVLSTLFKIIGQDSFPLLCGVLKTLANLRDVAGAELQGPLNDALTSAVAAMGPRRLLKVLPLHIREDDPPPKRADGSDGEPDTWLLPLLRDHTVCSDLRFFASYFLPLDEYVCKRAKELRSSMGGSDGAVAAKPYRILHQQFWDLFPAFCARPIDLASSFKSVARVLGETVAQKPDLRRVICSGLETLIETSRQIVINHERLARKASAQAVSDDLDQEDDDEDDEDEFDDLHEGAKLLRLRVKSAVEHSHTSPDRGSIPQPGLIPLEEARANLATVSQFAKNFLPILFNAYTDTQTQENHLPVILGAVRSFVSISDKPLLNLFFKQVAKKLIVATTTTSAPVADEADDADMDDDASKGGKWKKKGSGAGKASKEDDARRKNQVLLSELACAFVPSLSSEEGGDNHVDTLFKIIRPLLGAGSNTVQVGGDPKDKKGQQRAVQEAQQTNRAVEKRAWRALVLMCRYHQGFVQTHVEDLRSLLIDTLATCAPSSRKARLQCLGHVVRQAHRSAAAVDCGFGKGARGVEELIGTVLGDVVLCAKDANAKSRYCAFDLLLLMGRVMEKQGKLAEQEGGDMEDGEGHDDISGATKFVSMVSAGLAGTTPHMIAATVGALSRLFFEFSDSLAADYQHSLISTMEIVLQSNSREVIKSSLGFFKVAIQHADTEVVRHLLPTLVGALLADTSKRALCFKVKLRALCEKLVRKFGYDEVVRHAPESHHRLFVHIRKETAKKRQKENGQVSVGDDDARLGPRGKHKAFEEAISNDDDGEGDDDDDDEDDDEDDVADSVVERRVVSSFTARAGGSAQRTLDDDEDVEGGRKRRRKGEANSATWLMEQKGSEPLDLLHAGSVMRHTTGTDPKKSDSKKRKSAFPSDEDGRMVIIDSDEEKEEAADEKKRMEKDGGGTLFDQMKEDMGDDYVEQDLLDSDDEDEGGGKGRRGQHHKNKKGVNVSRKQSLQHSGTDFKSKKGSGDTRKKGKLEPYAYVKLDPAMLNKRHRHKGEDQYKGIVSAAKRGATKGSTANRKQRNSAKRR